MDMISKSMSVTESPALQAATAAAAAIAELCDKDNSASLAPVPAYLPRYVSRGEDNDSFFDELHSAYRETLLPNDKVIEVLNQGAEEDILSISNLAIPTPGHRARVDSILECKFFIDATFTFITQHGVTSLAELYRRMGMLPDRMCVSCSRRTVSCRPGGWRCCYCIIKKADVSFSEGMADWLKAGSPARHAVFADSL